MKAGRLTCEEALKKMLFTIFRRGYEIRVRCEDRSFSLRDEVDWTWLDMQRGKVDINFIVDPALPDLEASEIIQLDRTTLRRRKYNKMLLLSWKEHRLLPPKEVTEGWMETYRGENFTLPLRNDQDAKAKLKQ